MPRKILLDKSDAEENSNDLEVQQIIGRYFQSGNINFIFGSGASMPAIKVAGNIEKEIEELLADGDIEGYKSKMIEFLRTIQEPTNRLIENKLSDDDRITLENYSTFFKILEKILSKRKSSLLPKQASIFCANYDLFFEKASDDLEASNLNDGFSRIPTVEKNSRPKFSPNTFFRSLSLSGNLYDYVVEMPSINLVKIHGSMSWASNVGSIEYFPLALDAFDENSEESEEDRIGLYSLVLPTAEKFKSTVLSRIYYELLRLLANQMDKENTIFLSFGFSFRDQHIADIVKRGLKNQTAVLILLAFDNSAISEFEELFKAYSNVIIIGPHSAEKLDFARFNTLLGGLVA